MERIEYPVPQPVPALSVRRLGPDDAAQIAVLYRAGGRDGAWCGEDTVRALFRMGAVWWGGFAEGNLVLCAACAASTADTPQAAALRGALAPGTGCPPCSPEWFLLPPAISRQGEALAGPLLPLLADRLFSPSSSADAPQAQQDEFLLQNAPEAAAHWPVAHPQHGTGSALAAPLQRNAEPAPALLAALPVKAPDPVLAAYFAAGFAAVRMRPLVSLRPHYLFVRRGAPGQEGENGISQEKPVRNAPPANTINSIHPTDAGNGTRASKAKNTALPPKQEPDAVRRVFLPLADTLAVSRLLEQDFCATALCRSSADERTLIRLERGFFK